MLRIAISLLAVLLGTPLWAAHCPGALGVIEGGTDACDAATARSNLGISLSALGGAASQSCTNKVLAGVDGAASSGNCINIDWTGAIITNKPTIPALTALSGATSHQWVQWIGSDGTQHLTQPSTGDISGYVAPVNADWNAVSGLAQVLNKPTLGALAALGVGTGLSSGSGNLNVSYGTTAGTAAQGNDSRITGALQSGTYQPDWNAVSGSAQILNKPTLGTAAAKNVLGTGTYVTTSSASAPASNKCLEMDTNGNIVIAGTNAACGSGGGMTWPGAAGIALYGGSSAWGTSIGWNASTSTMTGNITGNAATVTGLSVTSGKTLTASNTLTLSGTDGASLAIGSGGTLGTGAYATIANYAPLASPVFTGSFGLGSNTLSALAYVNGSGVNFVLENPGGVSFHLLSDSANSSVRNWFIGTNYDALGDFVIRQSTARGGNPDSAGSTRLQLTSAGLYINGVGMGTTGTWTPTAGNISTTGTVTWSGTYTRYGNVVCVFVRGSIAGAGSIGITANSSYLSLPFTPARMAAGSQINNSVGSGGTVLFDTGGNMWPNTASFSNASASVIAISGCYETS